MNKAHGLLAFLLAVYTPIIAGTVSDAQVYQTPTQTRSQTSESHRAGGQDRPGRADLGLRSRLRASTMGRSWLWLQQLRRVRDPQG
ncbi:unnamed protein product [Rangifer tarandus platyrhynchus]|uniref:Uncharacterized protein n=1 Tax=Rangifer tarandus platyrhynchus TaxID=3082113 RepID=A0AC59Z0Q5_RANTA